MKKIIILGLLLFIALDVNAKTFITEYPTNQSYDNYIQMPRRRRPAHINRHYSGNYNDISKFERMLFNRTYTNDTELNRLSRLEQELFGTIHSGDINRRYDNIRRAIDCRGSSNKVSNFLSNFSNMLGSGYPTGYTPVIEDYEVGDFGIPQNYGRAIDSYYGNNWLNQRHYNHRYNVGNGMNIHILD